ncbi:HNH homing endonuclease [Staphylococcus phage HMGUsa2]|nr:HNH homing endonuclease [Staphylococcus phage HMGUsa2]VEV88292.1 HNH endonuclease [Staphylococcus phage Stab20]
MLTPYEGEIWKDIRGYEGLYQVSNFGRVRSLDRVIKDKGGDRKQKGRELKGRNTKWSLSVSLCSKGKCKSFSIHYLVALMFIGERPKGALICHNDGDYKNNRADNIRYDTERENMIDMYRQGGKSPIGKLSTEQVLEIKKLLSSKELSQRKIAEKFNVDPSTISRIASGKNFSWLNTDGTIQKTKEIK